MNALDEYIKAAQGASLPKGTDEGLFGSIGDFGSSIANSSVGKMASGLGSFLLDTAGQALSPAYKENLIGQNKLIRQDELRRQGLEYSNNLYGNEATSTPYDQITQELNPGIGMNEQPGTGFAGGKMNIAEYLTKQQSNPNRIIQTAASGMLRDRMQPGQGGNKPYSNIVRGAEGNAFGINQQGEQVQLPGASVPQKETAPLVQINNAEQAGRWATDEESNALGVAPGKKIWMNPKTGPRILTTETEKNVASGVVADSIVERLDLLDESLGSDYVPNIMDSLDQLGLPDAMNNLFRTPEGRVYKSTYNSMVADVVKDITGAASTDPEFVRLYNQLAYVTGDESKQIKHKRKLLDMRVNDMYSKSGRKRKTKETETKQSTQQLSDTLETGTIQDGYEFTGGDRYNKDNWRKL